MGNINASVDLRRDGETAVVTVENPPVNALKHEVRAGLAEALRQPAMTPRSRRWSSPALDALSSLAPTSPSSASRRSLRA